MIFENKIKELSNYLITNNIKTQILGISGGLDSTVCAAICHEVSKQTGIPLIGRSLPTKYNKKEETTVADLVGKAFCDDFQTFNIGNIYENVLDELVETSEEQTPIANGNIQARLRMIYLYILASIHKGLVIDTDNLTEYNLGFWTLHGDVGDYKPIGDLWKTEVFKLAEQIRDWYGLHTHTYFYTDSQEDIDRKMGNLYKAKAITESLKLKPTAGLGITNNDLEELGAESYEQVDEVLKDIISWKSLGGKTFEEYIKDYTASEVSFNIPLEIVKNIARRHFNSEFKRK